MPLSNIVGVDHVVVTARDLAAAAEVWRGLGFTVSPRGTHSAHIGTANHTIMLGEDYIELLGVLAETERNAATRAFLAEREGIERTAFTASDAAGLAREIKAGGLEPIGPLAFSRPVELADGRKTEARFETVQWPLDLRPGGMRVFACQHFTREAVWLPELMHHDNGATRIDRIELLAHDPRAAAGQMGRLIGQPVTAEPDGALRVASGGRRAGFVFLDRAQLARRHGGVALGALPSDGAITLALKVGGAARLAALARKPGAVAGPGVVTFAPNRATGVILEFSAA